ncbi:hypothetical protein BSKO_05286 [Bryopsis sp. KO-2023]|nr:hypothetical protein BSKO_05286 [Bryopsis sp. KO-2023]
MYPSVQGKVILVTGGGGALGTQVSLQLAKLGAKVYLADINEEAVERSVTEISSQVQGARVHPTPKLDLASMSSIREFVEWFECQESGLDVLINNAGANFMGVDPWYTKDGIAGGPQVNVLGPFALTRLLEPMLTKKKSPSRIVNVASIMHRFNEMPAPDVFMRDWEIANYGKSKLAVVMFTKLMQEKWREKNVSCACVDPGAVYTGIWKTSKLLGRPPGSWVLKALYAPPEDAVACSLHAAAADEIVPGGYYARGLFASPWIAKRNSFAAASVLSIADWPLRWISRGRLCAGVQSVPVAPNACDLEKSQLLWDCCSDLAGIER